MPLSREQLRDGLRTMDPRDIVGRARPQARAICDEAATRLDLDAGALATLRAVLHQLECGEASDLIDECREQLRGAIDSLDSRPGLECGRKQLFVIGNRVRYRPGAGTYGYEDAAGSDGRVPGTVVGFSRTRVRVELRLDLGRIVTRCVDAASLILEDVR